MQVKGRKKEETIQQTESNNEEQAKMDNLTKEEIKDK